MSAARIATKAILMANSEHLDTILKGAEAWNDYSEKQTFDFPRFPDLRNANLRNLNLGGIKLPKALLTGSNLGSSDLSRADLRAANFDGADLSSTKFIAADLRHAHMNDVRLTCAEMQSARLESALLIHADMWGVNLAQAKMHKADLARASIWESNLTGAEMTEMNLWRASIVKSSLKGVDLSGSDMRLASFSDVDLTGATLSDCYVYGTSAWNLELNNTKQQKLVITDSLEGGITVDNIEVAQFIYILTNNAKIRNFVDTITSKAVLILGRFSPEGKFILDRVREELRTRDYVPIMFDFEKAQSRDTIETIRILAGMAKFVIADLTGAKSVLQELQAIVPDLPSVAVRFIIKKSEQEPGMLDHIKRYPWVVAGAFEYEDVQEVIASIRHKIIDPAEAKVRELHGS